MSRYIVFEGVRLYHVLEDEDETACGVMVAAVSTLAVQPPEVTAKKPQGVPPCGRCLKAAEFWAKLREIGASDNITLFHITKYFLPATLFLCQDAS